MSFETLNYIISLHIFSLGRLKALLTMTLQIEYL